MAQHHRSWQYTRWRGSIKRSLLGTCLALLAAPLAWADVDLATLDKAEAMLKAGHSEEAYRLLEPLELSGAGDEVYDYLLGSAALDSNRPSKASFVFERILAVSPHYGGVRADMGRAYVALGDYGRAKIEFESVLAIQNLPPDLRSTVEQYARLAEARAKNQTTTGTGYVEIGIGSDSNIGSATGLTSLTLPSTGLYSPAPPTGLKTQDSYSTLALGGEVNHQLNEQWGLYGGADYRGRAYQLYTESGYATLDTRLGVSYTNGNWLLRTGLTLGQYNQNQSRIRDTAGASVDWRMTLNKTNQLSFGATYSDATYALTSSASQNTQTSALTASWLTSIGDGSTVFSLTGSYGVERAVGGRDDGDRRYYGPRLTVQKSFDQRLGAYVTAGATYSKYAGTNSLYLVPRDESLYDLTLGMTWSIVKGLSLRPQFTATRKKSKADLYPDDKNDLSINLRRDS